MTTGPGTGRLSTSETARAMLAILEAQSTRTPRPLAHTIELSRNAKGDVQWTITVNREDPYEAEQDAREIHDRLTRAYPHSSLLEAEPSLKAALQASVAEAEADPNKVAARAAAIARNATKGGK